MDKQNKHEEEIAPWQDVLESTGCTHSPSKDEVCCIVGMATETPPAGCEKYTLVLLTIMGVIRAADESSWLAPKGCVAVLRSNVVSLMVRHAEDRVAANADSQDCQRSTGREFGRISSKVLSLECIECWQPGAVTPCQHEAEMVVGDIYRPDVPVFVEKEVQHVEGMQSENDKH